MCPDSPASSPRQPWTLADNVARTIEGEVVPRLLATHRMGVISPGQVVDAARRLVSGDVERLVALLVGAPDAETDLFISALLEQGVTSEAIYVDLLAPAAHRLGEMWCEDAYDFVEVSVALGRMQRILRNLSQHLHAGMEPEAARGRVLLAGAPGEQHTFGLFMVAEFFIRDQWSVSIGPPFVEGDLAQLLRREWFDVVGFSVACDARVERLEREIRRARRVSRNRAVRVMVGGRVFSEQPDLVRRVGADACASDGRQAPAVAGELLAAALRDQGVKRN